MSVVEPRHHELLSVLARHKVAFVLVGGVALQVHGYSGATLDVDVTIGVDPQNATRVAAVLEQLHAAPYLAGDRGTAYRTDLGQLEIMRSTDGVGDYAAWMRNATEIELEPGLVVYVGNPSALLAAKETAARGKDLQTLPRIRAELLRAGTLSPTDIRGPVATLPSSATPDPRAHEILGPRPDERRARGLWDHAADLIVGYHERWPSPVDSADPLGDVPSGPAQQTDRAALQRQLDRTIRLLARTGHGPATRS